MKRIILSVLAYLWLLDPTFSLANDTVGAMGAGGIEFKKTADISMEKEVLTISDHKVRIEYDFFNKTDHTITERVFFPMPLYDQEYICQPAHHGDLEGFKVWVDEVPIRTSRAVRAVLKSGQDVSQVLKEQGMSDDEIANFSNPLGVQPECPTDDRGDRIAEDVNDAVQPSRWDWQKIAALGINEMWSTANTYYWDQTFLPGRITRIAHEYSPFVGYDSADVQITTVNNLESRFYNYNLCITNGTISAARSTQQKAGYGLQHTVVKYVLTTGANWSGPIKDFTLNLKKQKPEDVVSLCFDGDFKKTSPLTLTSHMRNFVPKKDLQILFLYSDLEHLRSGATE